MNKRSRYWIIIFQRHGRDIGEARTGETVGLVKIVGINGLMRRRAMIRVGDTFHEESFGVTSLMILTNWEWKLHFSRRASGWYPPLSRIN